MADDDMTFERVTKVYREESAKRTTTKLEPDFYRKLASFIAALEARAAAEASKDSNAPSAIMAQDELRKVKKKREQIFQYRERKIALLASSMASGAEVSKEGLTREELTLFDTLVREMGQAQAAAFGLGPPSQAAPPAPPPVARPASKEPTPPPPTFERLTVPAKAPPKTESRDAVVVHVLEDIPPFAGLDVSYHLRKEDVVSLPRGIAKVLVDRGKARLIQTAQPA